VSALDYWTDIFFCAIFVHSNELPLELHISFKNMGSHCQVVVYVNPNSEMEHNNELNGQRGGFLLGRPVGDEFILAGATQVVM